MPDSFLLEITKEYLAVERKSRKVDKILGEYLYDNGISLNKPLLARELAFLLSEEIRNNPNREKSYLEEQIEQIMQVIGHKKNR